MRRLALPAITLLASVLAGAAIVVAVRVVQHLTGSDFVSVPVTVRLPGASAHTEATVLALHASTLRDGRTTVSARKRATGLVSAISGDGSVTGEAVLPQDPLLKTVPVTVSYRSTAASLVLETPALITSSPLLAALIMSESRRSPAVGRLATVLRSDAATRKDYLTRPDAQMLSALGAAERDVSARVRRDFGDATAGSGGGRPPARSPPRPGPAANPSPGAPTPPPAADFLGDRIVLPDTTGQTACSTHRVTAALCLEHTYPLTLASPELRATDWSAGWQTLYLASQLSPGRRGFELPFALVPPVINAPPTIAGVITTALETGLDAASAAVVCANMAPDLRASCNSPSFLHELAGALLGQLTLAGDSEAVNVSLTRRLQHQPISAVGVGINPGPSPGASDTEVDAWYATLAMSFVTQFVIPLADLAFDVRAFVKGRSAESAETAAKRFGKRATEEKARLPKLQAEVAVQRAVVRARIAHAQSAVEAARANLDAATQKLDNASPRQRSGYQTQVSRSRTDLEQTQSELELAQATEVSPSRARAQVERAQAGVQVATARFNAATQKLNDATPRQRSGYQTQVHRKQALLHQAQSELETAQAVEQLSRLRERASALREEVAALQRQADLAHQRQGLARAQEWHSELFADLFEVVHDHQKDLACVYKAIRGDDYSAATPCLKPVLRDLVRDGRALAIIAAQDVESAALGFIVSDLLPGPLQVVDFFPNGLGLAQDVVELAQMREIPDRHDFPAIDTNYRRGSTRDQLATLYLGAVSKQALAGLGRALDPDSPPVTAGTALSELTGQAAPFITHVTTVCPDTVIMPAASVQGRLIGIANVSNWRDLHFAAGVGSVKQVWLRGAVPFAAVHSPTPLGSGAASFADPSTKDSTVRVVDEGAVPHARTFDGRVSSVIPAHGQPLVELVTPTGGARLAGGRGIGGFVFATNGRDAGQLVGLAEAENDGQLVVLTGAGVAAMAKDTGACDEGQP